MTTETLTLGQQLRQARNALQLSLEDVVQRTHLKKAHINALENDIFILNDTPPTFVRGYVRNYLRFLHLPEELVNSVSYGEKNNENQPPPLKASNHKSQARWVKSITLLVLLAAAGMTLTWWWQEHEKEQQTRTELVNNRVVANSTNEAPAFSSTPLSAPVESSLPSIESQTEVEPEPQAATQTLPEAQEVAAQQPVEVAQSTEATEATEALAEPIASAEPAQTESVTEPVVSNTELVNAQSIVNVLQQIPTTTLEAVQTEEKIAEEAPAAIETAELRIEVVNGQSWITVRGLKNKRLAEKIYNPGEVLTFNENTPYSLTIGAPVNVKIHYQGQEVPLKVDGRVARFKLPLAN